METVIRSARLAVGRAVLAAPTVPGQAPVQAPVQKVDVSPPPASRDPAAEREAWRREIEPQLRQRWQAEAQAELRRAADALREQAREDGLAEGRAAAAEEARRAEAVRQSEHEARWQQLAGAMREAQDAALVRLREDVATLAFAALCRLVGEQAAQRPFAVAVAEAVCREARIDGRAVLRLHPRDAELLGAGAPLAVSGAASLQLVADESVALGGCVVECEAGQFDGSLETQLRRLHAVLAKD